jgi:hypothetical protein
MESRSSYQKKAWWITRSISSQFSYKPKNPYHNIESTTVSGWNSYLPRYDPPQAPVGISQYSASPIYPPWQIIDDRSYVTGLSQEAILKIEELHRLMNKHPKYHMNPDVIIRWAIHSSFNGDNKFLDDKLEQLRTIDSLAKYYAS